MSAAATLLGRISRALSGPDEAVHVGEFTLRPAQHAAFRAVLHALDAHGGALLADAPGSGKTVVALAVASQYDEVLIVVPAALRAQWRRAAVRAGIAARIETIEGLSAGRRMEPAALIVVDEAHQLRNPGTTRHRGLARLAMHRHLLLLTATPVVNRLRDHDALLSLFLGGGASRLNDATRAAVTLRLASRRSVAGAVQRIGTLASASAVPGLGDALAALPPPLPPADGREAAAILRVSLAFAWASSLAALEEALRRRLERGRTLEAHLAEGQWPSRSTLRAWLYGDDATQLAFGFSPHAARAVPAGALDTLAAHLAAVRSLRALVAPQVAVDTARRADALRALLANCAPQRVVLLSHSAVTVRALYAALRHDPGVVAITGTRVHAAAGRWSRDEVLAALGPRARQYNALDPRGIRLLLATDILAEGVELQGASVLVHADPCWTPARLEQRLGRLAREGQREVVRVGAFALPRGVRDLLAIGNRLLRKRLAGADALRVPAAAAALRDRLAPWRHVPDDERTSAAAVRANRCGFIALLESSGRPRLLRAAFRDGAWNVSDSPRAIAAHIPRAPLRSLALHPEQLRCAWRVLRLWQRGQRAASVVGGGARLSARLLLQIRRRLEASLRHVPLAERAARADETAAVLSALATLRGDGIERQLAEALKSSRDVSALLRQLRNVTAVALNGTRQAAAGRMGRLKLSALLLLVSDPDEREGSGPALP